MKANKHVIDKSFKYWTQAELQDFLGLEKHKNLPVLENWLHTPIDLTTDDLVFLQN